MSALFKKAELKLPTFDDFAGLGGFGPQVYRIPNPHYAVTAKAAILCSRFGALGEPSLKASDYNDYYNSHYNFCGPSVVTTNLCGPSLAELGLAVFKSAKRLPMPAPSNILFITLYWSLYHTSCCNI